MASRQRPGSPPSETSFLSLPSPVRRRIYILAGLVRFCPIDLNHDGRRKDQYVQTCTDHLCRVFDGLEADMERWRGTLAPRDAIAGFCCFYRSKRFEGRATFPGPNGVDCVCDPLPTGLLWTCRAIYSEAVVTLYSENQFKICRTAPGGLTALSRMGVDALQAITRLHVRLNACGCVPSHVCSVEDRWDGDSFMSSCPSCHPGCKCGVDLPLSSQELDVRTVEREWQHLTRHLAPRLTPHQVRLSVVCDTLDHATAHRILQPLQRLPPLASCAIRLGQRPDPRLRLLAETAVRRAIGQPPVSSTSFPWQDLPLELQLRVLRHSGLVAPRPLEWTEGDGLETLGCCQQCTDALETCCCPSLHAAFASAGCRCWPWPRDHFLVNKAFRQQALQIVYNMNIFSVSTLHDRARLDEEGGFQHRSVLTFLQSIPRDALLHLRSLRIMFTSFTVRDLRPGTQSLTNWVATLSFIQQHLTLAQLDLTVCARYNLDNGGPAAHVEDREWQFYQRMAGPVTILQGVRSLFLPFAPTTNSARVARNLARQRELQSRALGSVLRGTTTTPRWGQSHPDADRANKDSILFFGPAGERIWPLPQD